jgi:hypothetical protein
MRRKAVFVGLPFLNEIQRPQTPQTFEFALTKRTRHASRAIGWGVWLDGHYGVEPNAVPTLSRRLAKFRHQKFSGSEVTLWF